MQEMRDLRPLVGWSKKVPMSFGWGTKAQGHNVTARDFQIRSPDHTREFLLRRQCHLFSSYNNPLTAYSARSRVC